jgi:peptidylprolyl isomerase
VPTNKQRREAARRHLERQLERRAQREAARKRFALISSVVGAVLVIALVVVLVAVVGGSGQSATASKPGAGGSTAPASTDTSTTAAADASCPTGRNPVPTAPGTGKAVSFHGVTVKNGTNLNKNPSIGSTAKTPPSKLLVKDLVIGKGAAATPTSTVSVKYTGVLYCDGTEFDGPAEHGDKAISFSLTAVVPGFTQGIGGTSGIAPMKVGGRRIIIMPASLGYGSSGQGTIPANAPLVFVVTLEKVS